MEIKRREGQGEREIQNRRGKVNKKKKKGKKEERKGGREPELTSRREQNRTTKDPELRYEK